MLLVPARDRAPNRTPVFPVRGARTGTVAPSCRRARKKFSGGEFSQVRQAPLLLVTSLAMSMKTNTARASIVNPIGAAGRIP